MISLPCLAAKAATSAAPTSAASTGAVKVGYVQLEKLMQSPASLEVGKKLQKEFTPRNAELQRMQKQIDDKEAALDKDMLTMSEDTRAAKSKEISDLKLEFQRAQRELSEDFEIRKREEKAKLQDRINQAVATVSKAEGYDLVLYGIAAYAGTKIDITDKVIKAIK